MAKADIRGLTAVRGVAALAVVAFHAALLSNVAGHSIWPGFQYGWAGVDLFFVLSGFLLALPVLRKPEGIATGSFWKGYLKRRVLRIGPPYYAAIAFALGLPWLLRGAGVATQSFTGSSAPATWSDVALHATFLHTFTQSSFLSLNAAFWTLGVEAQAYLAIPLLAWAATRRRGTWVLGALAASGMVLRFVTYGHPGIDMVTWQLPGFLPHFAFGVLAARAYVRHGPGKPAYAALAFTAAALTLVVLVPTGVNQAWDTRFQHTVVRALLAAALAVGVWAAAGVASPSRWFRLVEGSGTVSYSLYLTHIPVLEATRAWAGLPFPLYLALAFAVTLAVAVPFYVAFERPIVARLRKPRTLARPGPALAAALVVEAGTER